MDASTCPGCCERDAAHRRVGTPPRRVGSPARRQQLQLLAAALGQPARRTPSPSPRSPPDASPAASPATRPTCASACPPSGSTHVVPFVPDHCERCRGRCPPGPAPDDPEPTWHPGRRTAPGRGRGHRVPGPRPHLPLLRPPQRTRPSRPRSAPTASGRAWPPPWPTSAGCHARQQARRGGDRRGRLRRAGRPGHRQQPRAGGQRRPGAGPRRGAGRRSGRPRSRTSTRPAGSRPAKLCWLWAAATPTAAAFVIHARRGAAGLTALLGEAITGDPVQRPLGRVRPAAGLAAAGVLGAPEAGLPEGWWTGAGPARRWGEGLLTRRGGVFARVARVPRTGRCAGELAARNVDGSGRELR